MELQIIQNQIGRFNLIGVEESLSFSLAIKENNDYVEYNGQKCIIHYSGNDFSLKDFFRDCFENGEIGEIFNICFRYADNVISSINYKARCLSFWKVYNDNKKELSNNFIDEEKNKVNEQIKRLQNKLDRLEDFKFSNYNFDENINKKIGYLQKWIEDDEKELNQIKKGTEKYIDINKRISRIKVELKDLEYAKEKDKKYFIT